MCLLRIYGRGAQVIRRRRLGHSDQAGVGKYLGPLADAANVLFAVLGREAQAEALGRPFRVAPLVDEYFRAGVEPEADVVAIEDVSRPARLKQGVFERERDGALAGPTHAGERERSSLLLERRRAVLAS